jgi:hypothetical protein
MSSRKQTKNKKRQQPKSSLSWLLDESIKLPGGYRIGLDGIIGLIPGIGDIVSSGISSWLLCKAYQQGVPNLILCRMLVNILIDTFLGAIPVAGDIFDFIWKANTKNARLLEQYQETPDATYKGSASTMRVFSLILISIVVILITLIYGVVKLVTSWF